MRKLTKTQILKKMNSANIDLHFVEIRKDEIEVFLEYAEHVLDALGEGWGGYRTGYGTWIYSQGYQVGNSDYCDKSNSIHY